MLRTLLLFLFPLFLLGAPTVTLDPGHGGTDLGARAKRPYCEEKKLTLLTARLVKRYLTQLGYHVIMTRGTDVFIPLPDRVDSAKRSDSDLFVSIHYNSSRTPTADGVEVFFFDSQESPTRTKSSRQLASHILTRICRRTGAHCRGVKRGNFYVIRETSMPSVLVEGGFISNPDERLNLKKPEYLEEIARGIADGIDHYFKLRGKKP